MANKLSIVLVHGFWGGATHWSKVIVQLSRMGYRSLHAVENPLTAVANDAERTRKMIAQQKEPVLLVGHSYGGAVITEAGNHPNVRGLVYLAAFAPDVGENLAAIMEATPPPSRQRTSNRTATGSFGSRPTSSTRASARTCRRTRRSSWR